MAAASPTIAVLEVLRYAYPAAVLVYFAAASAVSVVTLAALKAAKEPGPPITRRGPTLTLLASLITSYIIQLCSEFICDSLIDGRGWPAPDSLVVGQMSAALVFGIEFGSLYPYGTDAQSPVWYPHVGAWAIALVCEPTLLALENVSGPHEARQAPLAKAIGLSMSILRICAALALVCSTLAALCLFGDINDDEEQQALLGQDETDATVENVNGQANGKYKPRTRKRYGTADKTKVSPKDEPSWRRRHREDRESMERRLQEGGNWFTYLKGFRIFWPYIWPVGSLWIKTRLVCIAICLLSINAINVLVPRQVGIIMDDLGLSNSVGQEIWLDIAVFLLLRFLGSESGIGLLRQWLWVPLRVQTSEGLNVGSYSHVMHLSADFHDSTSSGDIMSSFYAVSRLTSLLEQALFQTVPMFIDMVLAFVYLSANLGPYEGLITLASSTMFTYLATRMMSRRGPTVRNHENIIRREYSTRHNGVTGWQTVSSFDQVDFECNRHRDLAQTGSMMKMEVEFGWYAATALQSLALLAGLAASASLAVIRIRAGTATPGQFAMLLSYWAQLSSPLRYFVDLGKSFKDDFIYCERLLKIMRTEPSVKSLPNARPLKFVSGAVEFKDVGFSYDSKKWILRNLDLAINGGETVAFVGATGAGKSTVLRLIARSYDVNEGAVFIDGQDLRHVELSSLRSRIGIVPQNADLFADTIMNNVRYANITASDEEVEEACRAACMHDKIKTFTDGYDSFVGERGVKLSGGEKQRIAIARAILKKPDIVLLDEATSAVDTDTEQKIQQSLGRLCRGRTTLVIAHRLSTVKNADRIVVLDDGSIIEQGTHDQLIARGGKYADLWFKQGFIRAETAEETALGLHDDLTNGYTPLPQTSAAARDAPDTPAPATERKEASRLNPIAPEFTPRSKAEPEDDEVASPSYRHPRYSRRIQSKSEPSNSTSPDEGDADADGDAGSGETPPTEDDDGEGGQAPASGWGRKK